MNAFLFFTSFFSLLIGNSINGFEGLVVYEYTVGPGHDSLSSVNFFKETGAKTNFYIGNGNTLNEYVKDSISSGWGPLYLNEENKVYWIIPGNDNIPYYDCNAQEKKKEVECILLDSTSCVLGFKCEIMRYRDLSLDSGRVTKFYYFNDSILPKLQFKPYSDMGEYERIMKSYPLKVVTITPGYSTTTMTAIEIKPMDTDSIFDKYRSLINSNKYELLNIK